MAHPRDACCAIEGEGFAGLLWIVSEGRKSAADVVPSPQTNTVASQQFVTVNVHKEPASTTEEVVLEMLDPNITPRVFPHVLASQETTPLVPSEIFVTEPQLFVLRRRSNVFLDYREAQLAIGWTEQRAKSGTNLQRRPYIPSHLF